MENMLVVTLVLCAFCFYIGYAVGSDRTMDKMLKKNHALTNRLNDALGKNESLQKKVSELQNQLGVTEDNTIKREVSSNSDFLEQHKPSDDQESGKSSSKSELLPESDYENWFSTIFDAAALSGKKIAKKDAVEDTLALCVSVFNVNLFMIMLMTDNHGFEQYCFQRLKEILAGSQDPSFFDLYIDHYNNIIDAYNKRVGNGGNPEFHLKAILESAVDYFYGDVDDLERYYQVLEILHINTFNIISSFKEFYSTK